MHKQHSARPLRILGGCIMSLALLTLAATAQASPPHILILVADDLGWNDVGYHGSPIETPVLDKLANEGLELDRFYVQPTCTPTRATLMTGRLAARMSLTQPLDKNSEGGLPLTEKVLPQYLADSGYQRFMVGKWHLGKASTPYLPTSRGFEHFYGSLTGGIGYYDKVHGGGYDWQRNGKVVREDGYITHLAREEVVRLLDSRDVARPLFMYVAFQAPHIPNEAPEATIEKYSALKGNRSRHAAMVDELDGAIGDILQAYEDRGLMENTLVLFLSDNGGLLPPPEDPKQQTPLDKLSLMLASVFGRPIPRFPFPGLEFLASNSLDGASDNSPLRGAKGGIDEGAVRVPAIISWQGKLSGGIHRKPFTAADVLPTLLEAAGASIPVNIDGRSQLGALYGQPGGQPDYIATSIFDGNAYYRWPYKLVAADTPRLYDVINDPLESHDLSRELPQKVAELREALAGHNLPPPARIPLYDLLFDPDDFGGEEDREPWPETVKH